MDDTTDSEFKEKELIWLKEGIQLMAANGLANFRIDDLSRLTGKAKTSFYLFFNSREEFLVRLAQYWEFHYTDAYLLEVSSISDPMRRLEKLIELVYPNMKEELIWVYFKEGAISIPEIDSIVERAESKRVDVFCRILQDMDYPFEVANQKAKVFVYFFFGWSILNQDKGTRSEKIEQFKKVAFDLLMD